MEINSNNLTKKSKTLQELTATATRSRRSSLDRAMAAKQRSFGVQVALSIAEVLADDRAETEDW